MWTRTSSVLLATLVVSGLSLPRPDDAQYKIPSVGTGQRSQYYVLHNDGTFKYGFDTGDGAFESVKSHSVGDRDGNFGYVDPDGNRIHLEYEAGEGGFVARGDHLPKPSPELTQAVAAVLRSSKPFVDPLASEDSDASYGFEFQSDDHSRNEQSDADGTVTGSYSYVDENGVTRSFDYKAGSGIGFVIEGDDLTQDISAPTAAVRQQAARRSHQTTRTQPPSVRGSTRRTQTPSSPHETLFRASPTQSYTGSEADIAFTRSQTPGDASYSFSFDAGDHSRSETSDPNLNIDGTFSFVADDGERRTVDYLAGSSTGFQAEGDHLPKAPVSHFGDSKIGHTGHSSRTQSHHGLATTTQNGQTTGAVGASSPTSYLPPSTSTASRRRQQTSSPSGHRQSSVRRLPQTQSTSFSFPSRSFEEANTHSSFSPQGSYSFSYDTSSHSRSESGDQDNNVIGNFAFVADDDGERREVKFESGSATGFIAEGAHIPVGPVVPGSPSGQPTGRIVPVSLVPFVDPLADSDSDASYNFEFDSDTYSRRESSDKDGNIVGTYTIVDDDGTRRTYNFKAGEGVGFEPEEVSSSQGPVPAHRSSSTGTYPSPTRPRHSSRRPVSPIQPQRQHSPSTHGTIGTTFLPPSSPSKSTHSTQSFPDFTLNTYEASPDAEKYGYVLKFN